MENPQLTHDMIATTLQKKLDELSFLHRDVLESLEQDITRDKRVLREDADAKLIENLKKELE